MKHFLTLLLTFFSLTSFAQNSFVNVEILTDNYPGETTWEILGTNPSNENTIQIASGGPYTSQATLYTSQVLLNSNWDYEFIAYDSFGDGICCTWGEGLITLSNECEGEIWSNTFEGGDIISHLFNVESCDIGFGCTDPYANNYDPDANINDGTCEYPPCPGLVSFEVIQNPCQYPPQLVWEESPGEHCNVSQVMWASNLDQLGDNPYPINGATSFYIPFTIPFQTYYVQFKFGDPNGDNLSEIYEFVKEPCIVGCLDPIALDYNPFASAPGPCNYELEGCPEGEVLVSVEVTTDQYPTETTWNLINQDNIILANGGPYNQIYSPQISSFCLTEGDIITFNLNDAFGDGLAGSLWGGSDGSALVTLDCGNVQDTIFVLEQANFGDAISSAPYATQGCEIFAINGCTDPGFVEFDPLATNSIPEDCITPVILGCVEEDAFNYCEDCNQQETISTCEYTLTLTDGAGDGWFGSYLGVIQGDSVIGPFSLIEGYEESFIIELSSTSPVDIIFSTIGNSFTTANQCGFSLVGPEGDITLEGGTNIWNDPILPLPYRYRGVPYCGNTCVDVVLGCLDENAINFNILANTEDNSCYYNPGCTQAGYLEYYTQGFEADFDDGSCETLVIFGCTDSIACNYNSEANLDNEGCLYANVGYDCDGNCLNDSDEDGICDENEISGCTDQNAWNYNINATDDSGDCLYDAGCIGEPGEPYWLNDGCYAWVIDVSPSCCNSEWSGGCQELYDFCSENNPTVGIDDYGDNEIIVFPNPTTDVLNIVSNLRINALLYNSTGQCVINQSNINQIDMSHLESGIYNLILIYNDLQFTKKIVKQ